MSLRVSLSYSIRTPPPFQIQANNSAGSGSLLTPRFGFRTADSASNPWALAGTLLEEPPQFPSLQNRTGLGGGGAAHSRRGPFQVPFREWGWRQEDEQLTSKEAATLTCQIADENSTQHGGQRAQSPIVEIGDGIEGVSERGAVCLYSRAGVEEEGTDAGCPQTHTPPTLSAQPSLRPVQELDLPTHHGSPLILELKEPKYLEKTLLVNLHRCTL